MLDLRRAPPCRECIFVDSASLFVQSYKLRREKVYGVVIPELFPVAADVVRP
jgi:hypothetical protein